MSVRRLATVASIAVAAVAAGAVHADAQGPAVQAQGWAQTGVVTTFNAEDGRIYVAATAGAEEARAFVRVSDGALPSSTLSLALADDGLLVDQAAVRACLLAEPFDASGKVSGTGPEVDCTTSMIAERAEDGSWRVPLAPFAAAWSAGTNTGLALLPALDDAAVATFRLSFDTARTSVDAVPAETTTPPAPAPASSPTLDEEPSEPADAFEPSVFGPPISPETPRVSPPVVSLRPSPPVPSPRGDAVAAPAASTRPGDAFEPSWLLALAAFVVAAGLVVAVPRYRLALAGGTMSWPGARVLRGTSRVRVLRRPGDAVRVSAIGALLLLALLPLTASDLTVYRASLIPVYIVAVFGLHVLVNWAGELSFAHGSMVAVPAFAVLSLSDAQSVSPVMLLPVGVAVGIALGLVVSLPVLKVRGVQVAIVTLAVGVAVRQFLLTKTWFVGPLQGYSAEAPSLGPLRFESQRSLYVLILVLGVVALAAGWALLHSRVARAMFWVRDDPSAASAFGIPVARYRMLAFAVAGAFAGLAGGMMVLALGRLTPASFPVTLSLTYLVPVILVGPGFAGGLVAVALVLQGAPIFNDSTSKFITYLGPIALVLIITRYRAGLHGYGRSLMERFEGTRAETEARTPSRLRTELATAIGVGSIVAGLVAIAIGWYKSGNTDQLWIQNQVLLSGGIGGLALVIVGACLVLGDRVVRSHRALAAELRAMRGDEVDGMSGVAYDDASLRTMVGQ